MSRSAGDSARLNAPSGIGYRIQRSDRARRVRVAIAPDGVVVVLPRRAGAREADAAVRELEPWISRRLAEQASARRQVSARGETVPYLGETLALVSEPGRSRVHRRGDRLLVPVGLGRTAALERWYRRAAREEIAPRLDRACARSGNVYTSLTIRGQRTRWASCSAKGAMSFNWRLLLAPEPVLDYVVWHEVCHLRVMDHSPAFWAELARWCPDYGRQAKWLRAHGATLVL